MRKTDIPAVAADAANMAATVADVHANLRRFAALAAFHEASMHATLVMSWGAVERSRTLLTRLRSARWT